MNVHERMGLIRRKDRRRVVGLMSGTSADGVTAVVVEIAGSGVDTGIEILGFRTYHYPPDLREAVFDLFSPGTSTVDRICEMNFVLGEFFAECAIKAVESCGLALDEIDLIGSHGQTIHHLPRSKEAFGYGSRSTLQIGEAAVIAERTGVPTVADFRKADVAAGGEGAPLTPYLDFILHRHPSLSRVLQNIGGIANLTYLPAGAEAEDVVAFDTGPGNMVIDAVVKRYTGGSLTFDEDGRIASGSSVDAKLLEELLAHPYFGRGPPKTTGREEFGEPFTMRVVKEAEDRGLEFDDVVATVTALTVESIAKAYKGLLPEGSCIDEVYVSGGGAKNNFLMETLSSRLGPISVQCYDVLGISGEAKEALLMAVLANEHISGNPANLPKVTGASRPVVLGSLHPAS